MSNGNPRFPICLQKIQVDLCAFSHGMLTLFVLFHTSLLAFLFTYTNRVRKPPIVSLVNC